MATGLSNNVVDLTDEQLAQCLLMCNAGFLPARTVMVEAADRLLAYAKAALTAQPAIQPEAPAVEQAAATETHAERVRRLARARVARCRAAKRLPSGNAPTVTEPASGNAQTVTDSVTCNASPSVCVLSSSSGKEETKTHTMPFSSPAGGNAGNAASVTPPRAETLQSVTCNAPLQIADGFPAFWKEWCRWAPKDRCADQPAAQRAWAKAGHRDPAGPIGQLAHWRQSGEFKRGCWPEAAKFITAPKYTTPVATPKPTSSPAVVVPPAAIRRVLPDCPPAVQDEAVDELLAKWSGVDNRAAATARRQINDARHDWASMLATCGEQLIATASIKRWAARVVKESAA